MKPDKSVEASLGEFVVEPDIAVFPPVVKFTIGEDPCLGEEGPQWQRFTPTRMCHDKIGNESGRPQGRCRIQDLFCATALQIKASSERVCCGDVCVFQAVFEQIYPII